MAFGLNFLKLRKENSDFTFDVVQNVQLLGNASLPKEILELQVIVDRITARNSAEITIEAPAFVKFFNTTENTSDNSRIKQVLDSNSNINNFIYEIVDSTQTNTISDGNLIFVVKTDKNTQKKVINITNPNYNNSGSGSGPSPSGSGAPGPGTQTLYVDPGQTQTLKLYPVFSYDGVDTYNFGSSVGDIYLDGGYRSIQIISGKIFYTALVYTLSITDGLLDNIYPISSGSITLTFPSNPGGAPLQGINTVIYTGGSVTL